jgi:Tol biopolymer transport system component
MNFRRMLVVCGAAVAAFAAESGADLFQKALAKERADGDLRGAIALYERVASMNGVERRLAAESLFRLAECQQAIGNAEARKTYARVMREFADQREVAARAGSRLAIIEGSASRGTSELSMKRVWVPPTINMRAGSLSKDGRYLSFADYTEGGELALRDMMTGSTRQITHNRGSQSSREYASASAISPDGSKIAFTWNTSATKRELRVIDSDGSNQRTLYSSGERYSAPVGWSADGKEVLATISSSSAHTRQLAWIDAAGGPPRVLKSFSWQGLGNIQAVSPDGKHIAYDAAAEDGKHRRIYILASDGSTESAATDGAATDEVFGWMPDGKALLFATDRTGVRELRALPVEHGKSSGESYLVKSDLGRMEAVGVGGNGSLLMARTTSEGQVYTSTIDWASGKLTPAAPLARGVVAERGAGWSPDGSEIAYVARRGSDRDATSRFIVVHSLRTGQDREITPKGLSMTISGYPSWSPDGKSYLVTGIDQKGRNGAYAVDLTTGDVRTLVQREVTVNQPRWLPDGKHLLYVLTEGRGVFVRDLETGADREVQLGVPGVERVSVAVSPDGGQLAFTPRIQNNYGAIYVMPLAGGAPRLLYGAPGGPDNLYAQGWSPDSRRLIVQRLTPNGRDVKTMTYWMAAEGGPLHRIDTTLHPIHVHPDGQHVLTESEEFGREFWLLEHLAAAVRPTR